MAHNVFVWTLPIIMVVFEFLIRAATNIDIGNFIGPALAGAASTMLAPLTKAEATRELSAAGEAVLITREKDQTYAHVCLIALVVSIVLWLFSILSASIAGTPALASSQTVAAGLAGREIFGFSSHTLVGTLTYAVALGFLYRREKNHTKRS